jgi:hypothetical protein
MKLFMAELRVRVHKEPGTIGVPHNAGGKGRRGRSPRTTARTHITAPLPVVRDYLYAPQPKIRSSAFSMYAVFSSMALLIGLLHL